MKYVVLLAFFTSVDGKNFVLQSTTNIETEDTASCKSTADGVWTSFKDNKFVKIAAWCIPKSTEGGKNKVERWVPAP